MSTGLGSFWDQMVEDDKALEAEIAAKKAAIKAEAKVREEYYKEMDKLSVRVSKCYLVQVIDEAGNELDLDYVFCDTKKEAEERGQRLKAEVMEKRRAEYVD